MRISTMDVSGFGIFDGRRFEVDAPVVLFYGENEAGKSTLLQFVRSMLFGFPTRSQAQLRYEPIRGGRYGGSLQLKFADGKTVRLERYEDQGRSVKLVFADGTTAGEHVLQEQLGGVSGRIFQHLFAFGLTELQQLQTLQTEEAGRFLFSTGFGADTSRLLAAEKELEQGMDKLFRPRGKTQTMNRLVKDLERTMQELQISYNAQDEYNRFMTEIEHNEAEIERLEQHLNECLQRADKLQSALELRDRWQRRKEIAMELDHLPELTQFPADAWASWTQLAERYTEWKQERATIVRKLELLQQKDGELKVDPTLLQQREPLESLWASLGVYLENRERLRTLDSDRQFQQQALQRWLSQIDETWTEQQLHDFPLSIVEHKQVAQFRDEQTLAERELIRLHDTFARLSEQEKANRKERDTLRDASDASEHQLVKRLAGYSPLSYTAFQTKAKQYIEQMRDYREETRQLTLERQRWQDTMDLLPWLEEDDSVGSRSRRSILSILLPFALPASLWWFDQPLAALITFFLLLGFQGFILVRKTPGPIANQRTSLADRQRQMTERIAELEKDVSNRELRCDKQRARLELLLQEMLHPDGEVAAGIEQFEYGDNDSVEVDQADPFERWCSVLEQELDVLARIVSEVDDLTEQAESQRRRYVEVNKELSAFEDRVQEAQSSLQTIQHGWQQWLKERGLNEHLAPETVLELFRTLEQAKNVQLEMEQKKHEWTKLERDVTTYERKVAQVIEYERVEEIPALLRQRREAAVEQAQRQLERRTWIQQVNEYQASATQIDRELTSLAEQQQALLQTAGAKSEQELESKQQMYDRKQQLEAEDRQLTMMMEVWTSLGTYEELDQLLQTYGYEQLQYEHEKEQTEAKNVQRQLTELKKQNGALTLSKDQLLGGKDHADRLQTYEDQREMLGKHAESWAIRALSSALIQQTKEIVEAERQPRMLQQASNYFSQMTHGSFTRIMVPAFEKKLIVVRNTGEQLESSALSRGTAEQLYLAMRFALAEQFGSHVRLPIVLDDIFVNFDDKRMRQTLLVLQQLAQKHQIFMFTCHRHVREAVAKMIDSRHEIVLHKVASS